MSQYKPYPTYKDSGVQWLEQIPEHWILKKLKWLASLKSGNFITGDTIRDEGLYPVFGGNGLRGYTNEFTHEGRYALIGRQGALCGNVNYSYGHFWASEHAVVVSPTEPVEMTWIGELLRAMDLNQYSVASAQPGLAVERVVDLYVPVPTLHEQTLIAVHLLSETVRIDALIDKKSRFIDLLREKRQALIAHAITKGLDQAVKVKSSGVEWLGEIPVHWDMTSIKRIVTSIEQGWSPECESRPAEDQEWAILKVGCVNGGIFRPSENKTLPTTLAARPLLGLSKGDVLVSRANTRELVGSCAVIPKEYPYLMLCDKLYRLRVGTLVTSDFLAALISVYGRRAVEVEATGASSSMVNIAQSVILNLQVALPPLDEQVQMMSAIKTGSDRLDSLIGRTERSITLLRERRVALITAAVTGKIDLREAV